ncbi:MAG: FapA family protein [Lachnospiraceae bacterium]|nr:FapA family protein [Lachnospiraceae bacterium]
MGSTDELDELFGEEDLISLLDDVQEAQNKNDEKKEDLPDAGGVFSASASENDVAGENKASLESGVNEAYKELLKDLANEGLVSEFKEDVKQKTIEDYDTKLYSPNQLTQIRIGLEHGVDVTKYDSAEMMFRQMKEIRIGLEQGLDVSFYANKFYRDKQMREIRLGLMEKLDVINYARLVYSLSDMKEKRAELFIEKYKTNKKSLDIDVMDKETGIHINTKDGLMRAYFKLTRPLPAYFGLTALENLLAIYGISYGLCTGMLEVQDLKVGVEYEAARGEEPLEGSDGYYEYFTELMNSKPKVNADGSIDYRAQREFSSVKEGDKVAYYHEAVIGRNGYCVSGIAIPGYFGKDIPNLAVTGIHLEKDGKTYTAEKAGFLTGDGKHLSIIEMMVIDGNLDYLKGNIKFDGSVHVTGSVLENCVLEASGDVIIDGSVEEARIKSGRNVIIKKGMNGNKKGIVEAGNNVTVAFIEHSTVVAGNDIETGYILNSMAFCKGNIKVSGRHSVICGGKARAGKVIQASEVGSESGVRTELELSVKDEYSKKYQDIVQRRKKAEEEIENIREGMNTILRKLGSISGRMNPIYLKLEDALESMKRTISLINKEEARLDSEAESSKELYILVSGMVYRNTLVRIGDNKLLLEEDVRNVRYVSKGRSIVSV